MQERITVREVRQIERAIKQRWDIPDNYKTVAVKKLMQVIASPDSSERAVVSATRALVAMESQNQQDEHKVIDVELQLKNFELDEIAAELGIEAHLIVDAKGESGGIDSGSENESDAD